MSRLNLIVESLLRDIIEAQHAANCHAASLARQYGKHGSVRGFQLPGAQMDTLAFDLKYAVTGTSGVEEKQVLDMEQCRLFQQEVAERLPAYIIRSIVMTVVHSDLPEDEARSDFHALVSREEQWKKRFCDFLQEKIARAIFAHEGALIQANSGLDKGLLADMAAAVGEREFLDNSDLSGLFQGRQGDALRQECREKLRESLFSFIDVIAEKYVFTKQAGKVVVDVEVETEKLKKMPENSIQTLHMHISPVAPPAVLAEQNDISGLGNQ